MDKTNNTHNTIHNLPSRLDRYDLDWAHRHFKQDPLFYHKKHPNPGIKLETNYSIKPSQEMQQFNIRGVHSIAVFPASERFNRNYQHPMTHSVGQKQTFTYQNDPIKDSELDPKWRRDFRQRYFDFTKNFELENYSDTSLGKNSERFFPHLNKYHSQAPGVRHPNFYSSDQRYFPYQKNFLASDKEVKKKVDYLETVKRIREELKINRGIYFEKDEVPLEDILNHDPDINNALVHGDKDFYLFLLAFFNEIIEEIDVLENFKDIISLSEIFDCDLVYESFFDNLKNEGINIESLSLEIFVKEIVKPFLESDGDLVILEEDFEFFKKLSYAYDLQGDVINRFSFRKFMIGKRLCSNVVNNADIDKENLEIFSTILKIYFSVIKKLKYLSRVFFKKSHNFLESLEKAFPYDNQRVLERDFHSFLYSRKIKCTLESSNFLFRLIDMNNNGYLESYDIYSLVKLFN